MRHIFKWIAEDKSSMQPNIFENYDEKTTCVTIQNFIVYLNKNKQNNFMKDEIKLFDMNSNSDSKIHKEVGEIHQSKVTTLVVPPANKFLYVGF
jgi:hypothetical protein